MTEISKNDSSIQAAEDAQIDGVSRRKLIRAGLASTPILLGLKSESALATGTSGTVVCKPSMWSSIRKANCKLSRQVIAQQGSCKHYSYWAGQTSDSDCKRKFHDGTYKNGSTTYSGANFAKDYFGSSDKALIDVCKTDWTKYGGSRDELSRHCASIYLNLKKGYACPIDESTCKAMWNACKGGGYWAPTSSINWNAADCNEYLAYVCGKSIPTSC